LTSKPANAAASGDFQAQPTAKKATPTVFATSAPPFILPDETLVRLFFTINAASDKENLALVAQNLKRLPNFSVDIIVIEIKFF
jgi:hypothetical protein